MRYSRERKEAILKKLLPPMSMTVNELAAAEGISAVTLYAWRKEARMQGRLIPDGDAVSWSGQDRFAAVVETAGMNATELAEYCRTRGLYPEQVHGWRRACEQAPVWAEERDRGVQQATRESQQRIRGLERELQRKEKALAEAAALLILAKKAEAIWGGKES